MPLPTLVCLGFASGAAAAVAARSELRVSPKPLFLTHSFGAFLLFATLVLLPITAYFYVFHGDWFLLYTVDIRRVPSALALVGFGIQLAIGAGGFAAGGALVRNQRDTVAAGLAGGVLLASALLVFLVRARLSVVGTYAQFRGEFGLIPYGKGVLIQGTLVMGLLLLLGLGYLLTRLYVASKRSF